MAIPVDGAKPRYRALANPDKGVGLRKPAGWLHSGNAWVHILAGRRLGRHRRTAVNMEASVARGGWLRRVAAWAHHRHASWALGGVAFADSSFLPIPPDILLVPMALLRPERIRIFLLICIVGSSLGAILGYVIGSWLWSSIGLPMEEFYGYTHNLTTYQRLVAEWDRLV